MALREDVTSRKQAASRRQTTMRLQTDILDAADALRGPMGLSRTQLVEQLLAKFIRQKGGGPVRLKSLL